LRPWHAGATILASGTPALGSVSIGRRRRFSSVSELLSFVVDGVAGELTTGVPLPGSRDGACRTAMAAVSTRRAIEAALGRLG
jgi:hypothetical protein